MSKHGAKRTQQEKKAQIKREKLEALQREIDRQKKEKLQEKYILFLDDERDPSYVFSRGEAFMPVRVARSTEDAKAVVSLYGPPAHMALDHDLGGDDTTMVFLKWFREECAPKEVPTYSVHSSNPVGASNIRAYMRDWEDSHDDMVALTSVIAACGMLSGK